MGTKLTRKLAHLSALGLFLLTASFSSHTHTHNHTLCKGFLEENDWQIPATPFFNTGIKEADFHRVLDQVENYYSPILSRKGIKLVVSRQWSNGTVNASAEQHGNTYRINMYGGLARHSAVTADGFMLVACHEMGHHLGGAPKTQSWWGSNDWASNEGQSDYYATLRCLRDLWSEKENFEWYEISSIDSHAKDLCERAYNTQAEEIQCMRAAMAGKSVSHLFKDLRGDSRTPQFNTPDSNTVSSTYHSHPASQCRMDTYLQGSLCVHDRRIGLSNSDANVGTCTSRNGHSSGLRPRCWYRP